MTCPDREGLAKKRASNLSVLFYSILVSSCSSLSYLRVLTEDLHLGGLGNGYRLGQRVPSRALHVAQVAPGGPVSAHLRLRLDQRGAPVGLVMVVSE